MTAPLPYISLLLKLFAGAISLCLRQIRMKVRSFTINRSKALALGLYMKTSTNTVKHLLSGRLWDLPKCPLDRRCPLVRLL